VNRVFDWLQQFGDGAAHNVANKTIKGLKYEIRVKIEKTNKMQQLEV